MAYRFLLISLVFFLYIFCGYFSLLLGVGTTNASPVWIPSAIALFFVLKDRYTSIGVFLGALVVNLYTYIQNDVEQYYSAFFIPIGNTLEPILISFLLVRYDVIRAFDDYIRFSKFIIIVVVGCFVSALIGPGTLLVTEVISIYKYPFIFLTWWIGDMVGILLFFVPSYHLYLTKKFASYQELCSYHGFQQSHHKILYRIFYYGIGSGLAFFLMSLKYPLTYIFIPLLFLSVILMGFTDSYLMLLLINGFMILGNLGGIGPLQHLDDNVTLLLLQTHAIVSFCIVGYFCVVVFLHRRLVHDLDVANKQLERKVVERTRSLEEKNKELLVFSRTLSHDMHQHLRSIRVYSDLLFDSESCSEEERMIYLQNIKDQSSLAMDLVEDTYAFVTMDKNGVYRERIQLDQIMEELFVHLEYLISDLDADVVYDFKKKGYVYASKGVLFTILQNLITNSLKYHQPGVPPYVQVYEEEFDNQIWICVKDNGIGVPVEFQQKIFNAFFRGSNHSVEGTGLGLHLCYHLIKQYKGEIRFNSNSNGTTMFFHLGRYVNNES